MTQVSRYKLKPDVEKRIIDLFSSTLVGIKSKNELNRFLDDFLSPTERTVLVKRLAIAVLLGKENDYESIKRLLKVTPTTVSKMSLKLKHGSGALKEVVKKTLKKDATKILWEEFSSLFDTPTKGLPISSYHKRVAEKSKKIYRLKKEI